MFLYAFDLIELNGDDRRRDPLEVRKATLVLVVAKAGPGVRFNEHLECDDGGIVYRSIDELQADLDMWIREYNEQRPHQGRWCFGKTPMQTFLDAMPMAKEKMIAA